MLQEVELGSLGLGCKSMHKRLLIGVHGVTNVYNEDMALS